MQASDFDCSLFFLFLIKLIHVNHYFCRQVTDNIHFDGCDRHDSFERLNYLLRFSFFISLSPLSLSLLTYLNKSIKRSTFLSTYRMYLNVSKWMLNYFTKDIFLILHLLGSAFRAIKYIDIFWKWKINTIQLYGSFDVK